MSINRYAQGLLGLLDTKAGGTLPTMYNPNLGLSLELQQFYLASSRSRRLSTAFNLTAVGSVGSDLVVPDGKMWVLEQCHLSTNALTAGQALIARPMVFGPGNQTIFIGESQPIAYTNGDQATIRLMSPGSYILLNAGSILAALVERIAAGPIAASIGATLVEIQQ